ncbi:unnamed protein product [Orchesella dallaii]|uniref:Uncharacterized protein n=1 Tax=Orchesella dallaii TaxID=48710 RepID=A0ABP1R1Z7_9HEXA
MPRYPCFSLYCILISNLLENAGGLSNEVDAVEFVHGFISIQDARVALHRTVKRALVLQDQRLVEIQHSAVLVGRTQPGGFGLGVPRSSAGLSAWTRRKAFSRGTEQAW